MGGFPESAPVQDVRPDVANRPARRKAQTLDSRMQQTDIASELFFPFHHATWDEKGRLKLNKNEVAEVRTQISGVRFQAADPAREDLAPEQQCQHDLVELVRSLRSLREVREQENLVVARRFLKCRQPIRGEGTRIKFGLQKDPKGRHLEDAAAARVSHACIRRAIHRSGFVVEHPKEAFDPTTGLAGLQAWGRVVRLRRRKRWWPWLFLLPLLLLFRNCDNPASFFGVPIETQSLIILVDKSGSMQQHFPSVRAEAKRVLNRMKAASGTRHANIIAYDGNARSALGGLTEVSEESIAQLLQYMDDLTAGGGTDLRSGIDLAAKEVSAHERPTTLVILTDGQDGSIHQMLQDMKPVLDEFSGVEVYGNTLTPRLFGGQGSAEPASDPEHKLKALAEGMNGRFGPEGKP